MAQLGDFWIPLGALIGAVLLTLAGYYRPGRNVASSKTIHGAALIDSSIVQELVIEARRIAEALVAIQRQIEKTAHDDQIKAILEQQLRTEIDKLRQSGGKGVP